MPPRFLALLLLFGLAVLVSAQSSTPTPSYSLSAGSITVTSTTTSNRQTVTFTTVLPTTYSVLVTPTPTPSPAPIVLDTVIDPGFGVLGAILILSGIPSAFLGHKNRWTSFFLIGFYTLSLVCFVLILKFGVLGAVNLPSTTLRGLFVLAAVVAGAAGGAITIFFWKITKYFIGAWGGFAFGLFIQCMRNGGLIGPVGYRWIMYIGCGVVGFCLCTIPKIHLHVLLISTAFVGATSFMLGVDCYTTAGLKEFYVWNIGYKALFPKYTENYIRFPVTQTMQIELGLLGAVALMGGAVQLRVLQVLQRKLEEIAAEQRRQDAEAETVAAEKLVGLEQEKKDWEHRHGRQQSDSSTDMLKGRESSTGTPLPLYPATEPSDRPRYQSGVSDHMAPRSQSPGVIPALDFGKDIESDVPQDYITEIKAGPSTETTEDLAKKESLLAEIETIRRSIDILKSEPSPTAAYARSTRPSATSRRTLSHDLNSIANYRNGSSQSDARSRAQSMELSAMTREPSSSSMPRPQSLPLQESWDSYVQDRKLLQPPSGISAPIPTTVFPAPKRLSISPAVLDAVVQRQQREMLLTTGDLSRIPSDSDSPGLESSGDSYPVSQTRHLRTKSAGNMPVSILPPKKADAVLERPVAPRVATYEELSERHREKLRQMQAPLTKAEKEQADLEAAKQRWERSKAIEREVVTKRQAEESAALEKKRKSADLDVATHRRSRTLSADKLTNLGGPSSRRMSTLKVENWQKQQEGLDVTPRSPTTSAVPFPNSGRPRESRRSRDPPR